MRPFVELPRVSDINATVTIRTVGRGMLRWDSNMAKPKQIALRSDGARVQGAIGLSNGLDHSRRKITLCVCQTTERTSLRLEREWRFHAIPFLMLKLNVVRDGDRQGYLSLNARLKWSMLALKAIVGCDGL